MRHLGRIVLFVATIKKFLVNLKRHERALFDALVQEWTNRYLTKQGQVVFSVGKPTESVRTSEVLGSDLFFLVEQFKDNPHVTGMTSYQLLLRLLPEQCSFEQNSDTGEPRVSIKPNTKAPSDSLQNPSDPEASYDGHKGKATRSRWPRPTLETKLISPFP